MSLAVLLLMERLSPNERAVYVLREAFSYNHAEIADILDITESASQQHLPRARRHVTTGRRRDVVTSAAARPIVEALLDAAASGQTERLIALLTEDATAISDAAGLFKRPVLHPTPQRIAAAARAFVKPSEAKRRLVGGSPALHAALVNHSPAMIAVIDDRVVSVLTLEIHQGRIAFACAVSTPERLGRLTAAWSGQEHDAPIIESW